MGWEAVEVEGGGGVGKSERKQDVGSCRQCRLAVAHVAVGATACRMAGAAA